MALTKIVVGVWALGCECTFEPPKWWHVLLYGNSEALYLFP